MACEISYETSTILLNNRQFSSLIDFAVDIGSESAQNELESAYVERMKQLRDKEFWPGRGFEIETDFLDVEENKFWARVFFDIARAIFERRIGFHDHTYWQAQRIHQAYGVGLLFESAVRTADPAWSAESLDRIEFQQVINKR